MENKMNDLRKKIKIVWRAILFINSIERHLIAIQILESALKAVYPFINLFMISLVIDAISKHSDMRVLIMYVFVMIFLNAVVNVVLAVISNIVGRKNFKFNHRYNMAIANKMMNMHYETLDSSKTHNLRMKISEASSIYGSRIQKIIRYFPEVINALFTILFSTAVTLELFVNTSPGSDSGITYVTNNPFFAVILFALLILTTIINMKMTSKSTKKIMDKYDLYIPVNKISNFYNNQYLDSYHAGKDIRLYNQEKIIINELEQNNKNCFKIDNDTAKIEYTYANVNSVISTFINIFIYVFVGFKAWIGAISVGNTVKYIASFNKFTGGFTSLMNLLSILISNNQYIEQTLEFMSIDDAIFKGNLPVIPLNNKYIIEFVNVSFKYPDSDNYILKNINFKIETGDNLAIVGENGSGKTTFIKLLCGLYKPTKGEILLNGKNIYDYRYDEYLQLFSVVFQDFKLLSFQLGKNIAVCDEYDKEKVMDAIKKAGFMERFQSLENGLDTYLYNDFDLNGVEISGGEAQKIAIARAIYRDSEFIILDEPTAALDPIAEFKIYSEFSNIMKGKTSICISHRLSSCRLCNKIAVFDRGEIIQYGNHNSLMQDKGGKYNELWNAQARYYTGSKR